MMPLLQQHIKVDDIKKAERKLLQVITPKKLKTIINGITSIYVGLHNME